MIYKKQILSPYETMRRQTYAVQEETHPVQKEIRKVVGSYQLTAEVSVDTETLETLNHIPGLIAFVCSIYKNGEIIGIGHGSAVIGRMSKAIQRTVHFAANSALLSAVAQSTKAIDSLVNPYSTDWDSEAESVPEGITERQKAFLQQLITKHVTSAVELERWASEIGGMSRSQASAAIETFTKR